MRAIPSSPRPTWRLALLLACLLPGAVVAADGDIDASWAGGGRLVLAGDAQHPERWSEAHRIVIEADGRLRVAGRVQDAQMNAYWWLGEWRADGTPDADFGAGDGTGRISGCALDPVLCSDSSPTGVARQDDGRLLVAAGTRLARTDAAAHALDGAGTAGGSGIVGADWVVNDAQGRMLQAYAVAPTAAGGWIVAGLGRASAAATRDAALVVRLQADLSLDPGFNAVTDGNGVTFAGGRTLEFGAADAAFAFAVFVQDDGRIVVLGNTYSTAVGGTTAGFVARLLPDGALDPAFGSGGIAVFPQCAFFANGSHRDRAGRLLATCSSSTLAVLRVDAQGQADASFGPDGVARVAPPPTLCSGGAMAPKLALDSAGRVLLAGRCDSVTDDDGDGQVDPERYLVARLHGDDGSLDASFGAGGFVRGRYADISQGDAAWGVTFDASGRPLLNGYTCPDSAAVHRVGLARLAYDLIFSNDLETAPRGRLSDQ